MTRRESLNRGSHQCLHWRQQHATGMLHLHYSIPSGSKKDTHRMVCVFFGDPYGNRTHVTAVKGRCLNRLTNGPGSGDLIRTGDIPGMNRLLYQLSYAAIFSACRISFVIISTCYLFVKRNVCIFPLIFGKLLPKEEISLKIINSASFSDNAVVRS